MKEVEKEGQQNLAVMTQLFQDTGECGGGGDGGGKITIKGEQFEWLI